MIDIVYLIILDKTMKKSKFVGNKDSLSIVYLPQPVSMT